VSVPPFEIVTELALLIVLEMMVPLATISMLPLRIVLALSGRRDRRSCGARRQRHAGGDVVRVTLDERAVVQGERSRRGRAVEREA
jgi:hypothetical protein